MIDSRGPGGIGKIGHDDIASYDKDGYLIIRGFFADLEPLARVKAEITQLGKVFDGNFEMTATAPIFEMSKVKRSSLYCGLRYLPSLTMLASSDLLTGVSRQLGLSMPAIMRSYNIRMDMPNEEQFLFQWHQDISYLLGSFNSLTYWLPLGKADAHHGSVALMARSHRDGLAPVRCTRDNEPSSTEVMSPRDLNLLEKPTVGGEVIDVQLGDLVVFSQFLLHKSTPNHSDKTRWTIQIRHSDFREPEFAAAGFPFGDSTNLFHNTYLFGKNMR